MNGIGTMPTRRGAGIAAGLLLLVLPLAAQAAAPDSTAANRRNPVAAGVLEWVMPMAGYVYVGNWQRGLAPNGVRVTGNVLFLLGLDSYLDEFFDNGREGNPTQFFGGLALAAAGSMWAVGGAVDEAQDFNQRGGPAPRVAWGVVGGETPRLALAWRF